MEEDVKPKEDPESKDSDIDEEVNETKSEVAPRDSDKKDLIVKEKSEPTGEDKIQEVKVVKEESEEEKKEDVEEIKEQREMKKQGKEGSFTPIVVIMLISLGIAGLWESVPVIKNTIHKILDPSAGALLGWNVTYGMIILISIITFFMTLAQKYLTDQVTIKEMRKEQKEISAEMKKYRDNPEKMMEFQKKNIELMPKMFKLSLRPMAYTGVPLILFFRWFMDYFAAIPEFRFFGFFTWFWFYLVASIIISSIIRKVLDVV